MDQDYTAARRYNFGVIILAVGMPRAGSGWHFNLTHDLMVASGATATAEIRRRYKLESILTSVNGNIGALTLRRTLRVLIPEFMGETFTIKLHAGPSGLAKRLIERGRMRVTYIYRDPRDALLSAFEYGQRARQAGRDNAFSELADITRAIEFMREYTGYWTRWMQIPSLHSLRYEDFRQNYDTEAERLARHLSLDLKNPAVSEVIERLRPESGQRNAAGMHFQKGVTGRFRSALSPADQRACNTAFADVLAQMHYEAT